VELQWATELHAAFLEESRTCMLKAGAAMQEIRAATNPYVVFCQGKPLLADLYRAVVLAKVLS
jgi:hypothetical protein